MKRLTKICQKTAAAIADELRQLRDNLLPGIVLAIIFCLLTAWVRA